MCTGACTQRHAGTTGVVGTGRSWLAGELFELRRAFVPPASLGGVAVRQWRAGR